MTFVSRDLTSPAELAELMCSPFEVSPEQWEAIKAPLEPAVVVAGAGSGKTTLMAARVVWLVASGAVQPDQILGLTFTTKAAGELSKRIRDALRISGIIPGPERVRERDESPDEVLEPTVATYNAYAAALLLEHGLRIGHEPDTRVIADASRYQLAARAVARYDGKVEHLTDHPGTVIQNLLQMDAQLSEHLCSVGAVRESDRRAREGFVAALEVSRAKSELTKAINVIDRRTELLGLVESYRDLKGRLGLMDFADQIELAARLADERPEVGHAERDKYRIVLLDEYQDTSVAQALMLKRLFCEGHAVTAVGDPNQAIYGWRGASVSNILSFGHDFPMPDSSVDVPRFALLTNRRSDERIVEVANEIAAPLYDKFADTVEPLVPKADAHQGEVRVAVHETYDAELAWLPGEIKAAHRTVAAGDWSRIGVLTRDNAHAADVFHALSEAEIPVEIVGLKGLLSLPEVAEVVATLDLLHDLTANDAILTLLTGPRWAVGPRDLALLGNRARKLAEVRASRVTETVRSLAEELAAAVEGADLTEVPSLSDAMEDPGPLEYSPEALERFALLAAELRDLRRYAGEPLLDLVRRIISTTGIDIELASSVSPAAQARRDNLDLFVKAVAEFQAVDGEVTLPALMAYLSAEDEFGNGLDVATPSEADSVKLLTVHRAKGLEWAAVFVVGASEERFPNTRGRSRWTTSPSVLPSQLRGDAVDLPQLREHTAAGLKSYAEEAKAHDADEELRLGYVAFTRAEHLLVVSSYCWTRSRKTPLGPSPYQLTISEVLASWGETPATWLEKPAKDALNPLRDCPQTAVWPPEQHTEEVRRRHAAAVLVNAELDRIAAGLLSSEDAGLDLTEAARVAEWDRELERLLEEARAGRAEETDVPLPSSLSATTLSTLRDDPDGLAQALARPMPRKPSPSARFGTRFHAWVESHYENQRQELLLDPEDLPGRADSEIVDDSDLAELIGSFRAGPFANRGGVTVEPPFALVIAGQVVRGRIDAVFDEPDGGCLLVDWKTNRAHTADPLQLAVYRVAWSELTGIPIEKIRAAFYYVRDGDLVEHAELPTRADLEALLTGAAPDNLADNLAEQCR